MMTHTEFDAAYARLVAMHGCTARDASGKRAQAFAKLYVESGWTQEALAEKEKMSRITHTTVVGLWKILDYHNLW